MQKLEDFPRRVIKERRFCLGECFQASELLDMVTSGYFPWVLLQRREEFVFDEGSCHMSSLHAI